MAVGNLVFCLEYRIGSDSLDNARDLETAPESYIYLLYNTPGILPIPQTQATTPPTFPPCIPDSNPYRIRSTKCHINTVVSPDDGHIVAPKHAKKRNKHNKENCATSWLYLQDSSYIFDSFISAQSKSSSWPQV